MIVRVACVVVALTLSTTVCAERIPLAYEFAAQDAGVPAAVLYVVAVQESGMPLHHRLIPWPWTLNIAGTPERFLNRAQACHALRLALHSLPATRVDAGLGQINVGYQGARVADPCTLLDPYRNLAVTATILREQHAPGEDWLVAIGRYHRPAGGTAAEEYRRSVKAHWNRLVGPTASTRINGGSP
jgi:hypothetical protein